MTGQQQPAGSALPAALLRHALEAWPQRLLADLPTLDSARWKALSAGGTLARQLTAMDAWMRAAPARWARQWDLLVPARALAAQFEGQCVLLVFGKFNAGKSSLCNYLAAHPDAATRAPRYFRVCDGKIEQHDRPLAEGATETTTTLQGVDLGNGIVLLDTPGLHSSNTDNAALTRQFSDCADGMLWLSSSAAPGQVQELDDLVREIGRGKPLLPVITRSDVYDEDEVDGALVSVLCNKSVLDRRLQEVDVAGRAAAALQRLGEASPVLQVPVSISVHAALAAGDTLPAREAAGIIALQARLRALASEARAYAGRKQDEVLLHHLQENVLAPLQADLALQLQTLMDVLVALQEALAQRAARVRDAAWRAVVIQLPELLDAHLGGGLDDSVLTTLEARVDTALVNAWSQHLPALVLADGECAGRALTSLPSSATTAAAYQALHGVLQTHARSYLDGRLDSALYTAAETLQQVLQHALDVRAQLDSAREDLQALSKTLRAH